MPNVVHVWEKYGGENFLVVGVNLDDESTAKNMRKFVKDKGVTFPNITDYVGWQSPIARSYDLTYVPQSFLLSPDGTVMARDLRGDNLVTVVERIMELDGPYPQITMKIEVVNDPREEESFIDCPADQGTNPDAAPLNFPPDDIRLTIHVENHQADEFEAVLSCLAERYTGRRTYCKTGVFTTELYKDYVTDEPIIFYEIEGESYSETLKGSDGVIDTEYTIPLGEDVLGVSWLLSVYSPVLEIHITGADDVIDFAGYCIISREDVEAQGGIVTVKDD